MPVKKFIRLETKKKTESISKQHCCSEKRHVKKHFLRAMVGQDPSYSSWRSTNCWNVLKKQDRPSNRYRVLSLWRSNHHDLHRGCCPRRQFFRHAPIPWNMVVPPDNTTLAYKFSRMSSSHFGEVSWIPLASLLVTDSDDVFVRGQVGQILVGTFRRRFELCVVEKRSVAKFLFSHHKRSSSLRWS